MAFITVDNKELKRFQSDLLKFKSRAVPFATKATLNTAAFQTQREAKKNVKRNMTLRNNYTLRGMRVETAKTLKINKQQSVVGSVRDYMEDQEFGGTKTARGKKGVGVPTAAAAGQAQGTRPRTKPVMEKERISKIRLSHRGGRRTRGTTRKARTAIAIRQTIARGKRYVYLDLQKSSGIYRIEGAGKGRLVMVHSLSKKHVPIPANPWLKPAVDTVTPRMPGIAKKEFKKQLIRHRLFRR